MSVPSTCSGDKVEVLSILFGSACLTTTLACEPGLENLKAESRDLESLEPRLQQKVINIIILDYVNIFLEKLLYTANFIPYDRWTYDRGIEVNRVFCYCSYQQFGNFGAR